ncbi:prepilin peptidase [Jonesia denitrificans]|uniref:Prepilin leader peptidase/N-methyltransferase n=1 Tax=Jonesia denitrificans (strain ATCC 14870 / DSM 20603 / BCRC 15368 / CIP 55.134 / JCM 11481 / NBRC 15587 / NCTC 10816 / Prevot 55134) TaxID=471856 RepID=C7R4D9_JONDD|nr:A24 family peptidase [Jonesia denitrificans]ACV08996.1 peptidase A24A domain protein [Jonesia denitrificans DSM 20603]ASE09707.1 prepilin peptidase [Jonesia denitrificans]QXB44246.1 prepilin peptidase [Jonesia denitrificans]SQH21097.1 Leader peptidase pppA [Jonesia denitrificans]
MSDVNTACGPLIVGLVAVVGLVIGSFLNVVIWRVPRGESVAHPPSACPSCGSRIQWFDNVPVLSWLILQGRCRHCKERISPRYALVEALTSVLFALVALRFLSDSDPVGEVGILLPLLFLTAVGVALAFIDLDTHKLPNKIVLPAYPVVAVLVCFATLLMGWEWTSVIRAALGGLILYILYFVLCVIGGMGFGDVKLAGLLGISLGWLGWSYLIVGGFLPFVLGGLYAIVLLVLRRVGRKSGIPFGPWMILGWYLSLFVTEPLSAWYLTLIFGT